MTETAVSSAPHDARDAASAAPSRSPPKAIQLLLPVWGQRFVRQFLDFGLPTLLAPGNLPAIARRLPCKFIFLTSKEDAALLQEHDAYRYLSSICETEVRLIDDLITGDNYSTTITLAYARAVVAAGADMLDTCFFFLISDYLMADGSLARVLDRMQAGASGVLAGNFQVVAEDAVQTFYQQFDRGTPELMLPPRDLMRWALAYLHPMTAANMVNFPLCHSIHANRLFWRVDESTLIGRFYLMHMICIRPEVTDFLIGSSCDYSFIPEMCPSGNVSVLTDSDDYLVVEMQPRRHEGLFLTMGPLVPKEVGAELSEWTTQRHRENVRYTLIFHANEIPDTLAKINAEADAFVTQVGSELSPKPKPYRNHPYWIGAMAAHRWAIKKRNQNLDDSVEELVHVEGSGWRDRFSVFVHTCRFWVFGRAPHVLPWHPRWPDYRILQRAIRKFLGRRRSHILILSTNPAIFADWLGDIAEQTTSWNVRRLLEVDRSHYIPLTGQFDGCLLFLDIEEMELARPLTERIRPLLTDDGVLLVDASNGHATSMDHSFNNAVIHYADRFLNLSTWIESIEFVVATPLRLAVLRGLRNLNDTAVRGPLRNLPFTVIAVLVLALTGVACNISAMRRETKASRRKLYSSICMVLRPSRGASPSMPEFAPIGDPYWHAGRIKTASEPVNQLVPEPESA